MDEECPEGYESIAGMCIRLDDEFCIDDTCYTSKDLLDMPQEEVYERVSAAVLDLTELPEDLAFLLNDKYEVEKKRRARIYKKLDQRIREGRTYMDRRGRDALW